MRLWFWKKWLGPNIFWIIRYLLPYNKLFHHAAVLHDNLYYISYNKERADKMFLKIMIVLSQWNIIKLLFAYLYYYLVKIFWFIFYD